MVGTRGSAPARSMAAGDAWPLRNVCWQPELEHAEAVDLEGCTLRKRDSHSNTWTAATPLPGYGRHSWSCRIDHSEGNQGALLIGVCDVAGTILRVLAPCNGKLYHVEQATLKEWWRHADGLRVLVDERGRPYNLQGKANGSVIECIVDMEAGALAFRVNGGPVLPAVLGLPKGERLRPCVGLHRAGDQVSLISHGQTKKEGARDRRRRDRKRHELELDAILGARKGDLCA